MVKLCLNAEAYIKFMKETGLLWVIQMVVNTITSSMTLYRGAQRGEYNHAVRQLLLLNHLQFLTAQLHPLQPSGYYACCAVKRKTSKTNCNSKDELKRRILIPFIILNKDTDRNSCCRYRSPVQAVVENNGNSMK